MGNCSRSPAISEFRVTWNVEEHRMRFKLSSMAPAILASLAISGQRVIAQPAPVHVNTVQADSK